MKIILYLFVLFIIGLFIYSEEYVALGTQIVIVVISIVIDYKLQTERDKIN